ncbi:hypothetical protein FHX80_112058 [Streptomyces brevispora]|uniref:BMP family ABC transporter substrate-binding protein n=1 Tax=Streptomyces brevispora TaxID=887462 RepID=A0A561UW82_9ACTN|nr:BMP family ABC transporter substrate-binding protein [Streptomyces brevispora]TWG03624.1 hypothetical protein FHX80_112058 [Streptomyces brevispora]
MRRLLDGSAGLLRGRRGAWAGAGAVLVVCAVVSAWLFGGGDEAASPPDARARQYRDFDACLLTGEDGIAAGTPAAVWQGMQRASGDKRIRVTHVPVMGEQSAVNALPHLNGLIQRDCEVVLATGPAQTETVRKAASGHPRVRFVVVGPATGGRDGGAGNLTVVAPGDGLADEVAEAVRRAVKSVQQ